MNIRTLSIVALLAAAGIFFGYVSPKWSGDIASTKISIASDDQALAAAADFTTRQNALASERNKIDPAKLARLAVLLPDSVDNVGIILDLDALAAHNGLSLSDINVKSGTGNSSSASSQNGAAVPVSGASPVDSVDLSLSAVGTYSALQSFLKEVEKSERLLDVRDISVKGSDTGVYGYQMTLRLYWLH